ncbi:DUF4132 domain-containing protein [Clostridium sediminicola]|uniref:DUF4132 domain-containing protein n=1 Tax=Clostridium sediminicola TaxID=3114879 RepID=UPI0031F25E3C
MNMFKEFIKTVNPRYKKIIMLIELASKNKNFIEREEAKKQLKNMLLTDDIKAIQDIFIGDHYSILLHIFGDEWAKKAKYLWDHSTEYTYMNDILRRSFRSSKDSLIYINNNIDILIDLIQLKEKKFTLDDYLEGKYREKYFVDGRVISELIAMEINKGNNEIFNKIKDKINGDNNTFVITREIISGLLKAKREEGWQLIGKLLLAAKLQEGLRQSILESIDECQLGAFIYIYKIILDNNLSRFSSVVRAFDTWTGLSITAQKASSIKKCFTIGYECLTEDSLRKNYLQSDDNLQIYMALWAQGVIEVVDVESMIDGLMKSNKKNKQLTGLYFLNQTGNKFFESAVAMKYLDIDEEEVLAWVLRNAVLYEGYGYKYVLNEYNRIFGFSIVKKREIYLEFKKLLDNMPKKEKIYSPSVFPWGEVVLRAEDVIGMMSMQLSNDDTDEDLVDDILLYSKRMSVDVRENILDYVIRNPRTVKQREWLFDRLSDRSFNIRKKAVKSIEKLAINDAEYLKFEDMLKTKNGDLKKLLINLLLKREPEKISQMLQRILRNDNENRREAGLDMLRVLKEDEKRKYLYEKGIQIANLHDDYSEKELLILNKMKDKTLDEYSEENGFGLVNKDKTFEAPTIEFNECFDIAKVFSMKENDIVQLFQELSLLIDENREYEYTEVWGSGRNEKTVLGSGYCINPIVYKEDRDYHLEDYPLAKVWKEFFKRKELSPCNLLQLYFVIDRHKFEDVNDWYLKLLNKLFPMKTVYKSLEKLRDIPYIGHIKELLGALKYEYHGNEFYKIAKDVMKYILKKVPEENFTKYYFKDENRGYFYGNRKDIFVNAPEISFWDRWMQQYESDKNFLESFAIRYAYYKKAEYKSYGYISINDWDKAKKLGLQVDDEVLLELIARPNSSTHIRNLTNNYSYGRREKIDSPYITEKLDKVLSRILQLELKRGDIPTEVSHLAGNIGKFYGTHFFIDLIVGLGKEPFVRGYSYIGSDGGTKKEMFSKLLKNSYPTENDNIEKFRKCMEGKKIKDSRLIEGAMYAPQWIELVQEYLGWPGLKMTCWYFHAHVNESFSAEKETVVARYSSITPQAFNDGTFDKNWFLEAYETIGEERFKQVYKASKYISAGGNHKRSQMYTDAALGKIDKEEFKELIIRTRNKDKLMAFGLVPLEKNRDEDILKRYDYIQQFIKESKKYGSMRRASEGKAANIALANLAMTTGFSDVSRLIWNVEIMKIDWIKEFYKPREVQDVEIYLHINEDGEASIITMKKDKKLKNIPSRLKKESYIIEIKELQKYLKEQKIRARLLFEEFMNKGEAFTFEEIKNIGRHPVLKGIIKDLVLMSHNKFGFLDENNINAIDGEEIKLSQNDEVRIAHSYDLYKSGQWSRLQEYIYVNKIKQPFKQVFRELYVPTEDELLEGTLSRRYSGHQVQPQKTVALLRTRGWTVSYEEGLQKVYHDEDIIATVYAMADWFSPADIESPTLETVHFYNRKTYKSIKIDDIQKKIFSEVMRDLDLVVSMAHVGGVDPEASLSTVDMRAAIVRESVRLFKLDNVRIEGSHCFIKGKYGDYTVHLGSAMVHKMAKGAIYIVPVHSAHRGRIFLPFLDEDPKTTEVLSKILLLAEDNKIKDPSILDQFI